MNTTNTDQSNNDAAGAESRDGDGLGASPVRHYVPVMDRGWPDTAQTEMARLLDECANLGRENAELMNMLRDSLPILREYANRNPRWLAADMNVHDPSGVNRLVEEVESILSNAASEGRRSEA
jgi:hypothetical protein